jgi:hypothetical protein
MKKMILSALVAVCALALGAGASLRAQSPSALPQYEPGVAYVFDNGRVEQVSAVRGDRVVWAARSGRTYERSANPVVPILTWSFRGQEGERRIIGAPDKLWPLRVIHPRWLVHCQS